MFPPHGLLVGPEDAAFADVDGDGHKDVIVGMEGGAMVSVLFAPPDPVNLLTPGAWARVDLEASVLVGMRTMRVTLADIDGNSVPEIVVGGKEGTSTAASIGFYSSSAPRVASSWTYTGIRPVGWIQQMIVLDVDEDGDVDIVYTDRSRIDVPDADNTAMGLRWLESSGGSHPTWTDHPISGSESDHKWFDIADWDDDGDLDIVDCRSSDSVFENSLWLNGGDWLSWTRVDIAEPSAVGECQHVTFVDDVDGDRMRDLGISYSHADGRSGVIWLRNAGTQVAPAWQRGEIAGHRDGDGIKFDNLAWYDVDCDGDLDAVTSEQHEPNPPPLTPTGPGLGVIWYENPLRP